MKLSSVIKIYLRKLKKDSLITFFLWVAIVAFVLMTVSLALSAAFSPKEKYLSIANFFTFSVRVKFLDKNTEVGMFDIYTKTLLTKNNFVIEVYDLENRKIRDIQVPDIGYKTQLVSVVLSPEKKRCFFEADVKGLYYIPESGDVAEVTNVKKLQTSPTDLIVKNLESDDSIYVYPGNANISKLPVRSDNSRIIGVYPIVCDRMNDALEFVKTAKFYANYDAKEQRQYYEDIGKKIEGSQSSQDLRSLAF